MGGAGGGAALALGEARDVVVSRLDLRVIAPRRVAAGRAEAVGSAAAASLERGEGESCAVETRATFSSAAATCAGVKGGEAPKGRAMKDIEHCQESLACDARAAYRRPRGARQAGAPKSSCSK
jgi:hypothetical protein